MDELQPVGFLILLLKEFYRFLQRHVTPHLQAAGANAEYTPYAYLDRILQMYSTQDRTS